MARMTILTVMAVTVVLGVMLQRRRGRLLIAGGVESFREDFQIIESSN